MSLALLIFWAFVGWCGTPYPRWWLIDLLKLMPRPLDEPRPINTESQIWWIVKIIGIIGGLVGGWIYHQVFPITDAITGLSVAPTAIGALIGSIFLTDLYGFAKSRVRSRRETRAMHGT